MSLDATPLAAIPPTPLIARVTGTEDLTWFDHSGRLSVNDWLRALQGTGRDFSHFSTILDFGCGCGRVLRHLRANLEPHQRLIGLDVDAEAIAWVQSNLEGVEAHVLGNAPPAPVETGSVDLIVNHSVFTHLPEDLQFQWLDDLHRMLRPGGVAVLSIHGRKVWRDFQEALEQNGRPGDVEPLTEQFERLGFYYEPQRSNFEQALPEYYGATFHTIDYIERHWLKRFKLLAWLPVAALAHQDILVLEKF